MFESVSCVNLVHQKLRHCQQEIIADLSWSMDQSLSLGVFVQRI